MASISPINGTLPVATASSQTTTSGQTLGAAQFLQLLTTELQNQDPTQPVDDTQSVAQLAQFSALQATEEMNQSFQNFQSNFGVMQSASLIGKKVSVESTDSQGNSSTIVGSVSGIVVQNGAPYITMNDAKGNPILQNGNPELFTTNQIIAIEG
jgi:flagellar basal-body rod modification protein FlgD